MANQVLVDANVIVATVLPRDPHHKKATDVLHSFAKKEIEFVTNQFVQSETYTITLIRGKSLEAVSILNTQFFAPEVITVSPVPIAWHADIMHIFLSQQKYKGEFLSFADASLVVQARKQNIKTILTFDETFDQYKNEFDLPCLST